ncbi:hypothetical protein DVH24_030571 [Malus domestica]|uniref:Uncharacterized protein n=1 Tax=Malus domestica TaxID=3750 RepID=A0A498JXG1_MALDO|nr:hypothetical protein DVH24_030571 [Malus domestica]
MTLLVVGPRSGQGRRSVIASLFRFLRVNRMVRRASVRVFTPPPSTCLPVLALLLVGFSTGFLSLVVAIWISVVLVASRWSPLLLVYGALPCWIFDICKGSWFVVDGWCSGGDKGNRLLGFSVLGLTVLSHVTSLFNERIDRNLTEVLIRVHDTWVLRIAAFAVLIQN